MNIEDTTAIRRADSTEMLRYRMTRDLDPSTTGVAFTFQSATGTAQVAAGEWHQYADEEPECCGWYARTNVGPGATALAVGNYRVTVTITDGPEASKHDLGSVLIVAP